VTRVRFLGAGDAFGSGGRFQACILLEGGSEPVLMDCGATSLVAMKRATVAPGDIGTVLLSHLHGDHFGGLPFVILDGQFSRRERPLMIAGPPGVQARVGAAMEALFPGSSTAARRFDVRYIELQAGHALALGPCRVTPYDVDHASGAPSFGFRVEYDGRTIAYSGDTAWCDSLPELARGADLFICEGYSLERQIKFHMSVASLIAGAPRIGPVRTVLTHMSEEVLRSPPAGFEMAEDGLILEV
jgi:ribonuclease BN (tRNA processing enzyme)